LRARKIARGPKYFGLRARRTGWRPGFAGLRLAADSKQRLRRAGLGPPRLSPGPVESRARGSTLRMRVAFGSTQPGGGPRPALQRAMHRFAEPPRLSPGPVESRARGCTLRMRVAFGSTQTR
jgi:hypothetical protein